MYLCTIKQCGNSSVGRARPCQGRGREFESRFPLRVPMKIGTFFISVSRIGSSRVHESTRIGTNVSQCIASIYADFFSVYKSVSKFRVQSSHTLLSSFFISFNFIKASTGVSVSILVFKISSLICNNKGSSSWIKLSCILSKLFFVSLTASFKFS